MLVKQVSKSRWVDLKNQRDFFDNLAKQLKIQNPFEWGKVNLKEIEKHGGRNIIAQYNNSILNTLQSLYPDWWENSNYVNKNKNSLKYKNHRIIILELQKKLEIKEMKEWGQITKEKIIENGGGNLLKYYNNSILKTLSSNFPEWKKEWFINRMPHSPGHWNSRQNQILFFENLKNKLNIKTPSDWGKVTREVITHNGGLALLNHFNGSLKKALKEIYPDVIWKDIWFGNFLKRSPNYWNSIDNQRKFIQEISDEYFISKPKDWQRISTTFILRNGGYGLLRRYNFSIAKLMNSVFSERNWENIFQVTSKSKKQRIAEFSVSSLLLNSL